jgi:hypothetical protein
MILEVFDKDTRMRIDLIRTFTFVQYTELFCGIGTFEITIPYTESSLNNLKKRNYILLDDDVLGVIKYRKKTYDTDTTIKIKGYLLNKILSYRVFEKTYKYNGEVAVIARNMVNDLFISPTNEKRAIAYIVLSSDYPETEKVTFQDTGDSLDVALEDLMGDYNYGYKLKPVLSNFDVDNEANIKSFEFNVLKPTDRTIGNSEGNDPIVFSVELGNLSNSDYEEDDTNYSSLGYVAGEDSGENRKVVEVGNSDSSSIDRIEMYVDARDLQSEGSATDDGGSTDNDSDNSGGSGTDIDLSDYYTKTEVDDLIQNVDVDLSNYYTKEEVDNLISSSGANYVLNAWEVIGNGDYYFEQVGITYSANNCNNSNTTAQTNWQIIVDSDIEEYKIAVEYNVASYYSSSSLATKINLTLDGEYLLSLYGANKASKTFTVSLKSGVHYLIADCFICYASSGISYYYRVILPSILES